MNDQLFVKRSKPNRENFQQVRNDGGMGIKPRGGLWTSTYEPKTGSGWVEWCLGEDFGVPRNYQWHAWRLVPMQTALILEIDSYEDLRHVLEDRGYGIRAPAVFDGGLSLDYEKLAVEYDAVHLTEAGQWATRLSMPHTLYGWDCESTLWLHWGIAEVHDLGVQTWGASRAIHPQPGAIRRARRSL